MEKQVLPGPLVAGSHPGRGFRFKPPPMNTVSAERSPTDSFLSGSVGLERVRVRVGVSEIEATMQILLATCRWIELNRKNDGDDVRTLQPCGPPRRSQVLIKKRVSVG